MPCYHPLNAFQELSGGKLTLYTAENAHLYLGKTGKHLQVPCGQCAGCRRRRSLEWATRCMHEAQQHQYNSYITLTYNDQNLPPNNSLRHRDFVLFMKALRNALIRETLKIKRTGEMAHAKLQCSYGDSSPYPEPNVIAIPPRFYMAGEYGETFGRPHYHAILFGIDFADKLYHGRTASGEKIYKSPTLDKLWGNGYSSIGSVTFASAAYISRYIMKKRTGDKTKEYEIIDLETGEIIKKTKEYNCMSRKPGIAKTWYQQYQNDIINGDKVITKSGMILKPPRYYDKLLKKHDRALYESTKRAREIEALARASNNTPERLAVQEIVAESKARHQTRNLK